MGIEKFLNESEVAELLGCSKSKLRHDRMQNIGLPYVKAGRLCRYKQGDIMAFMDKHKVKTTDGCGGACKCHEGAGCQAAC
jgi:hypothetical protein